jgi:tetratricopeptide (TPR) repeat protein
MSEASMGRTFPDALERLVTKLLQTNANDRCQSATEAATELAKIKSFTVLPAQVKAERPQERNASKVDSWLLSKWTPIVAFVILFCLSVPLFLLARVPRFTAIRRSVTASSTIAPDHQDAIPEFDSPTASLSLNSANGQAAQKKYKEAIPHYQKAIGIYKRNSQWISEDNAKALLGLALCYQALGQYDASAQTLRQALPVYEKLRADKPELFAFHLSFIGSKYMLQQPVDRKHAWDVAEPLYKQSISIQEKLPDPTGTRLASLLYQQAQACFTCALYSDAQARYERSLALFRKASHNDNKTRVEIISSLVDTYARLHRCDRVQPLCQELLSTYDRCTDTEKKGATTDRLVQSATTCRDCALNSATPLKAIRQAGLLLEAVRQYYEKSETPPDQRVAILEKIGFTYTLAGDYGASGMLSQSEKTCRTALELRRQTHDLDSPAAALLFHELSNICRLQKRYTEAAALAKRAIDISKKNPGRKSLEFALALNGLAYVYLDQNDLAKAEPMYQQGLQICKNLEQLDSLTGVALLSGLATCKQRVGRDSEAIALFEQARRYYKTNFGPVCPNLKSLDQALARMRRQSNNNVTPSGR